MNLSRFKQVIKYGWKHASQISNVYFVGKNRCVFFIDILKCYQKYGMWSNQYFNERFWERSKQERLVIGSRYRLANKVREEWVKDFYDNRRFISKWSKYAIEGSAKMREKRNAAYAKRYCIDPEGLIVEHGVELSRQHHLPGTIKIGKNVHLCKNTFIDYSGEVIIEDGVVLTNGVIIESHHRDLEAYNEGRDVNIPTKLLIRENAYIGSRAMILDSCNYIGKNSRIGAGAVVTRDIPDYSVAVGVPAKVVKVLPYEK